MKKTGTAQLCTWKPKNLIEKDTSEKGQFRNKQTEHYYSENEKSGKDNSEQETSEQ